MVIVQEENDPVHDQTEHDWQSNKIRVGQATFGRARAGDFNHAATSHGKKFLANYTRCIIAVILWFFPQNALQDQNKWIRRFLKKPRDMMVQDFAHVIKIHNYLEEFQPGIVGGNSTKLPGNELLDLLECGMPIKWQRQMQVQIFWSNWNIGFF